MKLRIGAQLAAGVPHGAVKRLAQVMETSTRSLWDWRKRVLTPEAERPRMGRPRRSDAERALATDAVVAVQETNGWKLSGRAVHRALDGAVPLGLVQEVMRQLLAERERRRRADREARRLHVQVHGRNVLWSLDGTHLGREEDKTAVVAELVRDVASTKTLGAAIGPPPTSAEVVLLLTRIVAVTGEMPLAIARDNGGENRGELETWSEKQRVLLLTNLPRTPQHNPWVEHGNAELKAESGLGKGTRIRSVPAVAVAVLDALDHIDGEKLRTSREDRTAREAYQELPSAQGLVDREQLYREAHCAIAEAVQGCRTARERRLAERKALLATLERYGLITQTRGRTPRRAGKAEGLS